MTKSSAVRGPFLSAESGLGGRQRAFLTSQMGLTLFFSSKEEEKRGVVIFK